MKRKYLERWQFLAVLWIGVVCVACSAGGGSQTPDGSSAAGSPGAAATPATGARDLDAVAARLRTELAQLLKKDPGQLPLDGPVTELGADDLTVVEWQMAAERAFGVDIDDDKLFEPGTKTRADLTIASMAKVVAESPPSR